jgi:FkbM family methyltransferase
MLGKIALPAKLVRNSFYAHQANRDSKAIRNILRGAQIDLLDVGSIGGVEPRWAKIKDSIGYVGFEPDSRDEEEKKAGFKSHRIIPFALDSLSSRLKLNISRDVGKTSVYKPNLEYLSQYPNSSRFETVTVEEVEAKTIDEIEFENIDFIKLDIQGGELNALLGASKSLNSVLGIELEVEFKDLYLNQPLFGDVSKYLVEKGFDFIDFVNLCRWERNGFTGLGTCTFGDALFLRTPEFMSNSKLSEDKIAQYIAILYIYNRFDLIDALFKIDDNLNNKFKGLKKTIYKKRIQYKIVCNINRVNSVVLSMFGVEFRSHLIY